MRILICFDKFKDSMTAREAGDIAGKVFATQLPHCAVETVALADGGEGFSEILTNARCGKLEYHTVSGSLMQPVEALLGWVEGKDLGGQVRSAWKLSPSSKVAIIEMAQASGLQELPVNKRDCWKTTSLGTGELIRLAMENNAAAILLGVGGSSTNDLGLGVLEAIGLRFHDKDGQRLHPIRPELWDRIAHIEGSLPDNLPLFKIACDVRNPLFGSQGAAAIYGPQKGLKAEDHPRIEALGKKVARLLCDYLGKPWSLTEIPGSGAAGGITFGLAAACDVELIPGFDLVSQWLDLPGKLARCDWLITGEGKFDSSSLQGKGPGTLAQTARSLGKRVSILAGRMEVAKNQLSPNGQLDLVEISPPDIPLEKALAEGPANLEKALENLLAREKG